MRTDLVDDLPGKISNLARTLLNPLSFTSTGHNLASGIFISLWGDYGPPRPPFAKLGVIVVDEKALKDLFAHKGAVALKFVLVARTSFHTTWWAPPMVCMYHLRI